MREISSAELDIMTFVHENEPCSVEMVLEKYTDDKKRQLFEILVQNNYILRLQSLEELKGTVTDKEPEKTKWYKLSLAGFIILQANK